MSPPYFIAALGTPLDAEERLDVQGLCAHLDEQHAGGMDGVLVAGTMGMMQLLAEQTYRDLVVQSAKLWRGRGELFVGVGDAGFARTRDRIRLVNQTPVDAVVVLTPYFMKFSQEQLVDYFQALAGESRAPLYLYDLPQTTGTALSHETVGKLAQHPNIRGIKCSGDVAQARALIDTLAKPAFRVIVAQPLLVDVLLRSGVAQHLDGLYAMFPKWVQRMKSAAVAENWEEAARLSRLMARAVPRLHHYNVLSAMTSLLNARGVSGCYAPRPYPRLSSEQEQSLFSESTLTALAAV